MGGKITLLVALQLSLMVSIVCAVQMGAKADTLGAAVEMMSTENLQDSELLTMLYTETKIEEYLLPASKAVVALSQLVLSSRQNIPLKSPHGNLLPAVIKIGNKAWIDFQFVTQHMDNIHRILGPVRVSINSFLGQLKSKQILIIARFLQQPLKTLDGSLNDCISHSKELYYAFDAMIKMLNELCEGLGAAGMCSTKHFAQVKRGRSITEQEVPAQMFENFGISHKERASEVQSSGSFLISGHMDHYVTNQTQSTLNQTDHKMRNKCLKSRVAANRQLRAVGKRLCLRKADSTGSAKTAELIESTASAISDLKEQFGRLIRIFEIVSGTFSVTMQERAADLASSAKKVGDDANAAHQFLNSDSTNAIKGSLRIAGARIRTVSRYLSALSGAYGVFSEKYIENQVSSLSDLQTMSEPEKAAKLEQLSNQGKQAQKFIRALANELRKPIKKAVEKSKVKIKEIFSALGSPSDEEE